MVMVSYRNVGMCVGSLQWERGLSGFMKRLLQRVSTVSWGVVSSSDIGKTLMHAIVIVVNACVFVVVVVREKVACVVVIIATRVQHVETTSIASMDVSTTCTSTSTSRTVKVERVVTGGRHVESTKAQSKGGVFIGIGLRGVFLLLLLTERTTVGFASSSQRVFVRRRDGFGTVVTPFIGS